MHACACGTHVYDTRSVVDITTMFHATHLKLLPLLVSLQTVQFARTQCMK